MGFKHQGLGRFFATGDTRGIPAQFAKRIRIQLDVIDAAAIIAQMDVPGWDLHQLEGDRKGVWAIKVSGNWRITLRFDHGNAFDVDFEDYH